VVKRFEDAILKKGRIQITNATFSNVDPAPGKPKKCRIKYFSDETGPLKCRVIDEYETTSFKYDIMKIEWYRKDTEL
jgi:hypothetical protein